MDKKVNYIKEGWFHQANSAGEQPYLIGSRCEHCGFTVFPKTSVCPSCMKDDAMHEIQLGSRGKLDSFTVAMQGPPGFDTTYIQAFVTLPDGIRIFTTVEGCKPEPDALKLGQEMELVIGKIKVDEKGNDVTGWKFRPVSNP
jgi:uncharacterized protein